MAEFNPFANSPAPAPALPQAPASTPPASPEELEARKSKWRMMFDAIDNDPNVRNALISFGAQMLQPIQANDTFGASLGRAVNNSIGYLQATRQAGMQQQSEAEKSQAEIELTRAQAQKAREEAETTRPRAESAVALNTAQAANLDQATASSALKTPAELAVLRSQSLQNIASAQAAGMNADTARMNAQTNAFDSRWRNLVAQGSLDLDERKLKHEAEKLAKEYEIAQKQLEQGGSYTPSADMQMLSHYIALNGGDVEKGTEQFVQVELAQARASAITSADAGISRDTGQNLLESAGFPRQAQQKREAIEFAKANGYPKADDAVVNSDGTITIYQSGKPVAKLNPEE